MIELKNITKIYNTNTNNTTTALQNITMDIKKGEFVILKGSSGSGKSTILSLIAALLKPTSGDLLVDTKQVSKLNDNFASEFRRDNVGFVFQKFNLVTELTVKENILLPLVPLHLSQMQMQKKLDIVMQKFKISHKADAIVKNLSGGEQQRVAIARANINNPKIILADEPTANLDKELSLHFIEILRELKNEGKTIVVATHDPLFFHLDFVDKEIELEKGLLV